VIDRIIGRWGRFLNISNTYPSSSLLLLLLLLRYIKARDPLELCRWSDHIKMDPKEEEEGGEGRRREDYYVDYDKVLRPALRVAVGEEKEEGGGG